jgi:DNA-directed RNA polymerase specialized sigma24 family protein
VDLESAVELEALVAVVRTLPQKTQQVLILRKGYSWPVERIAERALLSEAAVLRHLATAARDLEAAARACTRGVIEGTTCGGLNG